MKADFTPKEAVFGAPPQVLGEVGDGAIQVSPMVPGSVALEELAPASLDRATVLAPPGAVERRYVLALFLRALKPGAPAVIMAPKDLGGSRLRKDLEGFGCAVDEDARRHFRICRVVRPISPEGLDEAVAAGAPRVATALGLWSQPGIFSWDRVDPGSALLERALPPLAGAVADLGCGVGFLSRTILKSAAVTRLDMLDIDRRATEAAARNIADSRAVISWADVRSAPLSGLDAVVTNPPFHRDGTQDHSLGQAFIVKAAESLRRGGTLWLVANRHLPYEAILKQRFSSVEIRDDAGGYKVIEARR